MVELRQYQLDGAAFLAERSQGYLADDPGLGKTVQNVTACDRVSAQTVLVVCPASTRGTWATEFAREQKISRAIVRIDSGSVADDLQKKQGALVCVVSYDLAVSDAVLRVLKARKWDVLIFDEAHYLKSADASRAQKLIGNGGLAFSAARHWLASGTPTPNHIGELWTVLRVFFPAALYENGKPLSYNDFLEKYCILVNADYGVKVVGHKDLTKFRERLKPFILRRTKSEVAKDLPPISFSDVLVDADPGVLAEIAKLEADARSAVAEWQDGAVDEPIGLSTLARMNGLAKVPAVVELIVDALTSGVEKLVVFGWHKDVLEGIYKAIYPKFSVVGITGDTPATQRDRAIERFQKDPVTRVFLGQIKAAGTGITLTAAHNVLFAEMAWCPADNAQAAMRCHRLGQTMPVSVRFAKLAGSLDEAIVSTLRRKTALIDDIFTDLEKRDQ